MEESGFLEDGLHISRYFEKKVKMAILSLKKI
jgi:hypothetical protein